MQKPKLITEDMMRNDAVIGEIWMHGRTASMENKGP